MLFYYKIINKKINIMKRVLLTTLLSTFILPFTASAQKVEEPQLKMDLEIVAIQNYANLWVYTGEHDKTFRKYLNNLEPHKLDKGFILIELAGIENKGWKEPIAKTEKNIKHSIKPTIVKYLEGKVFNFECPDIKDNIPQCIIHVNRETNFNQYLLLKGVSKLDNEDYIPKDIKEALISAQNFAEKNKIGVWKPFYGVLEEY